MKPAATRRQPRGLTFQQNYEPDMSCMVKALRAVLESRPKPIDTDQVETEPTTAAVNEKQVG